MFCSHLLPLSVKKDQLLQDCNICYVSAHTSSLHFSSPAVQWGMEPGGGGLPEDQLQPRELRQRSTLLQEPQRKHRLAHHLQTSGLCAWGTEEAPATRQGKYCISYSVRNTFRNPWKPGDWVCSLLLSWQERTGSDSLLVEPVSNEICVLRWFSPDQFCTRAPLFSPVIPVFQPFFIKLFSSWQCHKQYGLFLTLTQLQVDNNARL